ncbi:MAG: hypothetical protein GY882_05770 [Actinomycetia bacterium]|nr:hypothetical protein [Actinomycetes bacterium]MCP4792819.1 hypothetical protein [Actinomycetes bacterium]
MSVEISGATTYSAGGPFSPGIVNVSQGGNRVGAVGSVEGPEGGSARLGARVIPVPWLRLSIGRVWVSDRSAGVHLVLPYVGRPNVDGDTVSGVAKGLQWVDGPRYVAPVEIAWTVRDLD